MGGEARAANAGQLSDYNFAPMGLFRFLLFLFYQYVAPMGL